MSRAAFLDLVGKEPRRKELFIVLDVAGTRLTPAITEALRAMAKHDEPIVRASAACGLNSISRVIYRALNLLVVGRVAGFETREQAMDWVAATPEREARSAAARSPG